MVTYEMDAADIRRAVLRSLIDSRFNGVARQLALCVGRSEGQINDMLASPPRKSFGEKIARMAQQATAAAAKEERCQQLLANAQAAKNRQATYRYHQGLIDNAGRENKEAIDQHFSECYGSNR